MNERKIKCGRHGASSATFVCGHIADGGRGLGFCLPPEPTDAWPDAICDACAAEEPEWTHDEAVAKIRLICALCWEDAFARNTRVPPHANPRRWIDEARHRAAERQGRWADRFAIDDHAFYQIELEDEVPWLGFGEDAQRIHVRCDPCVIGVWSRSSESWLWGWANTSMGDLADPVIPLKRFGEANGLEPLWRTKSDASEDDAVALAACALAVLPGLEAIYRAPSRDPSVPSLFLGVRNTRYVT